MTIWVYTRVKETKRLGCGGHVTATVGAREDRDGIRRIEWMAMEEWGVDDRDIYIENPSGFDQSIMHAAALPINAISNAVRRKRLFRIAFQYSKIS